MSLANKTIGGFVWAFAEQFGARLLQMIILIVLARLLSPEAFGLIGMLAVFIAISRSLTNSGFEQALIQKKDPDERDYSSVFYLNLVISTLIYLLLFSLAPWIATFYREPSLILLIRVLGIKFIISAFSIVQIARLTKLVKFKSLMLAKLPSTLIGGILGIVAAIMGFGVWSLVIQQLASSLVYSSQVWWQSTWRPKLIFDWKRVKSLFDFGGKMMVGGLIHTVFKYIYEILIGRYFMAAQVGFYTQANKIKNIPVENISNTLQRVTFPILSDIQHDNERLKKAFKKIIRQVFLIIAPMMMGGIVLAEPLFQVVLGDKWIQAVPYFQWLCVTGIIYPLNTYNLDILKVKGRSDLYLRLEIYKKIIIVISLGIAINYSAIALVIANAVTAIINYFVNSAYSNKLIGYNRWEQWSDIWKVFLCSIIMSFLIFYISGLLNLSIYAVLIINILIGIFSYLLMIVLLEKKLLKSTYNHIFQYIQNKK